MTALRDLLNNLVTLWYVAFTTVANLHLFDSKRVATNPIMNTLAEIKFLARSHGHEDWSEEVANVQ